jgi:hypothetical protein
LELQSPTGRRDKLKPFEAERKGKFYLVWTKGKKCEQRVKGNFEAALRLQGRKSGTSKTSLMASNAPTL